MNVNTEILKLWLSRDESERTGSDAESVADIAWGQGLQLHRNRQVHYQRVMFLIGHRNIG